MSFVLLMAMVTSAPAEKMPVPKKDPATVSAIKVCPDGTKVQIVAKCKDFRAMPAPVSRSRVATPRNHRSRWITTNDYPTRALLREMEGISSIRLAVDHNGRANGCTVFRTSGFRELDEAACRLAMRRARFNPALDSNGNRIKGSFSTAVRWQIPEGGHTFSYTTRIFPQPIFRHIVPPRIADHSMYRIDMSDYPADALADGEQGTVTVRVIVGADGKIVHCRAVSSDIKSETPVSSLEKRSCDIVRQKWSFLPAENGDGVAQASAPEFKFVWAIEPSDE